MKRMIDDILSCHSTFIARFTQLNYTGFLKIIKVLLSFLILPLFTYALGLET
jgi:SPX domain protein involved in polyphosphate accumulation